MMRRLFTNLFLLGLAGLAALLLFEGILRLCCPIYAPHAKKNHESEDLMEYNSGLGWFHKKDFTTWVELQEYATKIYLNNKGLRGKEYDYAKPEGVRRIIVLGDSFAFGLGVGDQETFSVALERLFQDAGKKVEVINMGVNGYGTAQEYLLLEEEGMRYSPDIVICLFFAGNDIQNNISGFEYGKYKPYFSIDGMGLKLNNHPVPITTREDKIKNRNTVEPKARLKIPFKNLLQNHSYAYIFLRLRYNYLLHKLGVRTNMTVDMLDDGWDITSALFIRMKESCDAIGAKFLLVIVPTKEQMHAMESDAIQKRFSQLSRDHNIECLDLLPYLKGRHDLNFVIDSHWNRKGHKAIAQIILARLKDTIE